MKYKAFFIIFKRLSFVRNFLRPEIGRLTLSWRRPLSYRNESIDLQSKPMDWFLYDIGLYHERVKDMFLIFDYRKTVIFKSWLVNQPLINWLVNVSTTKAVWNSDLQWIDFSIAFRLFSQSNLFFAIFHNSSSISGYFKIKGVKKRNISCLCPWSSFQLILRSGI